MERAASLPPPAPSRFIDGRLPDLCWVILAPLLALFVLQALWRWSGWSDMTIYAVLFALVVTGHHMPGWLRAFGEPEVYEQHKARLWVALLAIPALVIVPTVYGFGMLALCVAAIFDLWHVAMQQHGFGRIYAAKAGEIARRSARLDLACILVWYATAVAWSDAWMSTIAATLRVAGLPLFGALTPESWHAVRVGLAIASAVLLLAYVAMALRSRRELGRGAANKHVLHAVAFVVLFASYQDSSWYRANAVQNLFHAAQYFFMVWIYGHLSVRRAAQSPRAFYRWLFENRRGLILFGAAIALYGFGAWCLAGSRYRLSGWSAERTAQVLGSIGLASLLLHFYVDSFIWKVRSRPVRRTLGIAEAATETAPTTARQRTQLAGACHALCYFGIPTLLIALVGARQRSVTPEERMAQVASEAALFPRSAQAHQIYAQQALDSGQVDIARTQALEALRLSPSLEGPAYTLAQIARKQGATELEVTYLEQAIDAAAPNANLHYDLAVALAQLSRLDEAEVHYRRTIELDPHHAGAHMNLGTLFKWRDRLDVSVGLFRRAYELEPERTETACNLAGSLATLGHGAEALRVLGSFRERHPDDPVAARLEQEIRRSTQ